MVRKIFITILFFLFVIFTNSCFLIYETFVYDSDIDERRQEMNNTHFVDSLPSLKTGNADPSDSSYSFIVLTDTHLNDGKTDMLDVNLKNAIETHDPAFVIILGDITDGEEKDYNTYIKIAEDVARDYEIPFYPVLGNHDLIGNGWKHWKKYIGSTNYIITDEAKNATLIILDSANIYYGKDQLNWLEAQLRTINTRDVFVFSHTSLFAPGYLLQIYEKERARMTSILRNKCDAIFTGHIHARYTHRTGNVDYITVESYREDRAYCIVNVTSAGNITYEFKKF